MTNLTRDQHKCSKELETALSRPDRQIRPQLAQTRHIANHQSHREDRRVPRSRSERAHLTLSTTHRIRLAADKAMSITLSRPLIHVEMSINTAQNLKSRYSTKSTTQAQAFSQTIKKGPKPMASGRTSSHLAGSNQRPSHRQIRTFVICPEPQFATLPKSKHNHAKRSTRGRLPRQEVLPQAKLTTSAGRVVLWRSSDLG